MRMSHLASIVFACSISIFATASLAQQPSNDGRCDVLGDATPSLYGLCIAYWATQENGNSEASSKILEKYAARKSEDDPGMPGLTCPCWNGDELTSWETDVSGGSGPTACVEDTDPTQAGWFASYGYTVYAWFDDVSNQYNCQANAPAPPNGSVVDRVLNDIGQIEGQACINGARASAVQAGCPI